MRNHDRMVRRLSRRGSPRPPNMAARQPPPTHRARDRACDSCERRVVHASHGPPCSDRNDRRAEAGRRRDERASRPARTHGRSRLDSRTRHRGARKPPSLSHGVRPAACTIGDSHPTRTYRDRGMGSHQCDRRVYRPSAHPHLHDPHWENDRRLLGPLSRDHAHAVGRDSRSGRRPPDATCARPRTGIRAHRRGPRRATQEVRNDDPCVGVPFEFCSRTHRYPRRRAHRRLHRFAPRRRRNGAFSGNRRARSCRRGVSPLASRGPAVSRLDGWPRGCRRRLRDPQCPRSGGQSGNR